MKFHKIFEKQAHKYHAVLQSRNENYYMINTVYKIKRNEFLYPCGTSAQVPLVHYDNYNPILPRRGVSFPLTNHQNRCLQAPALKHSRARVFDQTSLFSFFCRVENFRSQVYASGEKLSRSIATPPARNHRRENSLLLLFPPSRCRGREKRSDPRLAFE